MAVREEFGVVVDFFRDGAKIIFASLVVGVLVPGAAGAIPWLTFAMGIAMTMLFLSIAVTISGRAKGDR